MISLTIISTLGDDVIKKSAIACAFMCWVKVGLIGSYICLPFEGHDVIQVVNLCVKPTGICMYLCLIPKCAM